MLSCHSSARVKTKWPTPLSQGGARLQPLLCNLMYNFSPSNRDLRRYPERHELGPDHHLSLLPERLPRIHLLPLGPGRARAGERQNLRAAVPSALQPELRSELPGDEGLAWGERGRDNERGVGGTERERKGEKGGGGDRESERLKERESGGTA